MKIDYDAFYGNLEPVQRERIQGSLKKKMMTYFRQAAIPIMLGEPLPKPVPEIQEFFTDVVRIKDEAHQREWIRGHPLFQEIKEEQHRILRGEDVTKKHPKQVGKRSKRRRKNKR